MDSLRELLEAVRERGAASGRFRGLLHVLVGRTVRRADGTVVASGMTWRELAALLKKVRWDREAVRELGLSPKDLPPRDREKFWYAAIARAGLASPEALAAAAALAEELAGLGYEVGPPPAAGKEGG
jgi:hypothetical protein